MELPLLTPWDFVRLLNQTLELAFETVIVEGELANLRVSKNRWLYFDLQDQQASVKFFGTVYSLPGPLQDGMRIRVIGQPRLHSRFGFNINVSSIAVAGEGSIKKAADLLAAKLQAEGLFAIDRKRPLPDYPLKIGLITAGNSAAYGDFLKILNERWGGVEIYFIDVYVQGAQAPLQIVRALRYFNHDSELMDIVVITRGGGDTEDLAAFSDERVVRAIAASRIPTLVAVGHEDDVSLAELAADQRASTPSNAAQMVVPSRRQAFAGLAVTKKSLFKIICQRLLAANQELMINRRQITNQLNFYITEQSNKLLTIKKLLAVLDPAAALKRGYAIISKNGLHVNSLKQLTISDRLQIQLSDGEFGAKVLTKQKQISEKLLW